MNRITDSGTEGKASDVKTEPMEEAKVVHAMRGLGTCIQ